MIEFHNVIKTYHNGHAALNGITLKLAAGEMAFLTGHSGAGKSTLLKLINFIERPSKGHILVDNINLTTLASSRIPWHRRKIGMVFQNNLLLNDRNIFANVALPLQIAGLGHDEIHKRVRVALSKVDLSNQAQKFPDTLSSGEQQRVGIARAIVATPRVLLADEPTGNLDPDLSRNIMSLFEQFSQLGVTVLIASHDIALIQEMSFRVLQLDQGQLLQDSGVNHFNG
ncbi:Cell-division-associated, ABC-transporter-like signaling protein FtsE [hydrothermal vent metagenome]|uniref:Cell division ATP-binding protein FtsE n=1 Tax=hydrothermal vent metagenome TaxID=652676 RepID=A0A3B0YPV3_9ZZZZ